MALQTDAIVPCALTLRRPAGSVAAAMVSGENFHVADPVHGDGLMNCFVLESHYGRLECIC
jgi:hypothetical protein